MKKLFVVDLDNTLANTARDLMGDTGRVQHLTLAKGAKEFLEKHGKETVLLSAGVTEYQQKKLEVLDIQKAFRDIVFVLLHEEKAEAIKKIIEKQKVLPGSTIVVGDRIDKEIKFGNAAGTKTVRVLLPEGPYGKLEPLSPQEEPTYTVKDFFEFMELPIF